VGVLEDQKFKEMCEAELKFPERWGVLEKEPFHGGGKDILASLAGKDCMI